MTDNYPIAEARRVLGKWSENVELREALSNLLTHVERLTAPVTGDRAELVRWHNMVARTQRSNDWAPHAGEIADKHERTAAMLEADARREPITGDRAELVKCGLEMGSSGWVVHDRWKYDAIRALEADARREAALAGAIAEIEEKAEAYAHDAFGDYMRRVHYDVLAILAKVSAEAVGNWHPDHMANDPRGLHDDMTGAPAKFIHAGRPDGGER